VPIGRFALRSPTRGAAARVRGTTSRPLLADHAFVQVGYSSFRRCSSRRPATDVENGGRVATTRRSEVSPTLGGAFRSSDPAPTFSHAALLGVRGRGKRPRDAREGIGPTRRAEAAAFARMVNQVDSIVRKAVRCDLCSGRKPGRGRRAPSR